MTLCALACRAASPGPVDTVTAYAAALREGRYADAYRMLSAPARQGLSYEEFERAARESPDEARDTAAAYERADPDAPLAARLELPGGDGVRLLREDGAWRVDPAAIDFYPQQTPRQALWSFARALERERWDVLLRLAPRAAVAEMRMASSRPGADGGAARSPEDMLREAWTGPRAEQDHAILRVLVQTLERGANPEVSGDTASLTYGAAGRYVARLVREDGLWKVVTTACAPSAAE